MPELICNETIDEATAGTLYRIATATQDRSAFKELAGCKDLPGYVNLGLALNGDHEVRMIWASRPWRTVEEVIVVLARGLSDHYEKLWASHLPGQSPDVIGAVIEHLRSKAGLSKVVLTTKLSAEAREQALGRLLALSMATVRSELRDQDPNLVEPVLQG